MARSLHALQPEQLNEMSALELFQQQLESGSVEATVDAMKRLGVVAFLCGPTAVEQQLLPYLTQMVLQPSSSSASSPVEPSASSATSTASATPSAPANVPISDELLLVLGQQLPAVAQVLKDPNKVPEYLPLLERLAGTEETVVRDQAVIVLQELCRRSATAETPDAVRAVPLWMGLVKRLAGADWFTAKVSCAGVVPSVFGLVKAAHPESASQQYELLALYKELCQDDTPMVRRAAARYLGSCVQQAGWGQRDFGAVQVALLAHDEQDSVRLLAVAALAQAGREFGEHPTWTVQHWLPVLKDGSTDMSW